MDGLIILGIASGGFCGAALRFIATQVLYRKYRKSAPWILLVINILGSFILGMLYGDSAHVHDNFEWTLMTAGFCGSFTTYSTFSRQLAKYWLSGEKSMSIVYAITSFSLAIFLFGLGITAGQWLETARI